MKKQKNSNNPPKYPTSDTEDSPKPCSNPVEPYRSYYMDIITEDPTYARLSFAAMIFLHHAVLSKKMILGIGVIKIPVLAGNIHRDPSQFRVALQELENAGLAVYDYPTETLWLPRFFDFHPAPTSPGNFSKYLAMGFEGLPWSEVKQEAGRELIKLAKSWGPEYEVFNVVIRREIRKPYTNRANRKRKTAVLKLITTNNNPQEQGDG